MIREVKIEDYEQVKKLIYQIHDLHCSNRPDIYNDEDPLTKENFNLIINNKTSFNYVYIENNKICGLLMATKKFNEGITIIKKRKLYFIETIVVDEQYRRKGIAKKLYNHLLKQSINDNADAIELNVWSFNKDAIKFYESLGMTIKEIKFEQLLSIR